MNRLTILRHAKSSWDHTGLQDKQRPLNERGRHDAPLMGRICSKRLPVPDLILVSSAQRTRETAALFLEAWGLHDAEAQVSDYFYLAGREDWVDAVRPLADSAEHLLICGHQPGLGDLAYWLCSDFREEVPTGAVISFTGLEGGLWENSGTLDYYDCPRNHPG